MDAAALGEVIGNYNEQTAALQIGLLIFLILGVALSYAHKVNWAAKFVLGIVNLFIAAVFLHSVEQNRSKNISLCHYICCAEHGLAPGRPAVQPLQALRRAAIKRPISKAAAANAEFDAYVHVAEAAVSWPGTQRCNPGGYKAGTPGPERRR